MRLILAAISSYTLAMWTGQVTGRIAVPDLACRGENEVAVGLRNLQVASHASSDLYRFAGGRLYLSSGTRDEYFYNEVREVEPFRYVAGHKTIMFDDPQFRMATAVHVDERETRVLRLRCVGSR
jgi:hypothetical protein